MRSEGVLRGVLLATLCFAASTVVSQPQSLPGALRHAPPALRAHWQLRANQLAAMSPAQRQALERQLARFDAQPSSTRTQARERWLAWRALPALQRGQVQAAAAAFAALPAAERDRLRAQFQALDAAHRRGWLLGPTLGLAYPGLQPLLAYAPAEQRAGLLLVLHAMSMPELADLAMLAQRTPPEARDELRRALLSTSARNRAMWLRLRLDR